MTAKINISMHSFSAIAFGLVVLLLPATSQAASTTLVGESSKCFVVNPNRMQCNFTAVPTTETLTIQYVSMQCGSTGSTKFSLQEFQLLAIPPGGSSEVAYQIPIFSPASLGGVVNTGHGVSIYAKGGFAPRALIDVTPAPTGSNQCTASISGVL